MTDAEAELDRLLETLFTSPPPSVAAVVIATEEAVQPRIRIGFVDGSALAIAVEGAFVTSPLG